MDAFFFIVGCQRTGTTLMRLMLECHSRIFCYDELRSYPVLAGDEPCLPRAGTDKVGFKIPRWTEQLGEPILWDDGLPTTAKNFYTGQRMLFMVRDLRDTVASMLKLRWAGVGSWLELWAPRIVQAKARRDPEFARRYSTELQMCASSSDPLIATGALYWKYKTAALLDYQKRGLAVLGIRYERLVSNPEPVLREVCRFLDVAWEPTLLQHPAFAHTDTFEDGLTWGQTDPRLAVHAKSVGQWSSLLTAEQSSEVLNVAGGLDEFLYTLLPCK